MLPKHVDQLTETELDQWLRHLVDTAEPEGVLLDYKEQLNLHGQRERRDVAKDITSFANELGGTLIYGIPEQRNQAQGAPTPKRPYGIAPVPGADTDLENIFATTISPMLPESRIRQVPLSEYPGKVCYVVWTPESWIGPHMVHGYGDGRFYRRSQFRAVIMSERDVEERYRRRLSVRNAAHEFIDSEDVLHLGRLYGRNQAKTTLTILPLLLIPNRVTFNEARVQNWLGQNTLWRSWNPSMYGVKTLESRGTGDRSDVEIHRNGAIVAWQYTAVNDINAAPLIAYIDEFRNLSGILRLAGAFYSLSGYTGPLMVSLTIHCPQSYALVLPLPRGSVPLEPSGTSIRILIEPSASEMIAAPNVVLRHLADELFRAFGLWEADCFDAQNRLVSRRGQPI